MRNTESNNNPLLALVACLALIFLYLVFRATGLYPVVLADEYTYSKLSRLLPLSESHIPGYLYLKGFSITNYCGDGFHGCARLINTTFFVSAALFIFLICSRLAGAGASFIVSVLAVMGPINSYTAYFMPESLYFFGFWLLCWYMTTLGAESNRYRWLVAGTLYSITALIKPHSVLFLPSILAYVVFVFHREQCLFSRRFVFALSLFILSAIVARFGIGYIFAGTAGLSLFGVKYGAMAAASASDADKYVHLLLLALESLKGHILVVALLYGLPLTVAVAVIAKALFTKSTGEIKGHFQPAQFELVSFLALVVVLNLLFVVAIFTASVADKGVYESPYRLHMRYYNFALPLFYIVAAGALYTPITTNKYVRYVFGVMIAILGIYAIMTNLAPYTPSFVDSPEIRGLHVNSIAFQIIGAFLIIALILWMFYGRKGIQLYVYIALPIFVATSSYNVGAELNNRLIPDVYDKAGIFTRLHLPDDEISKVVIVGSEAGALFRSLFHLDNAKASLSIIPRNSEFDLSKLPQGKEWVLLIGDHELVGDFRHKIPMNGFSLVSTSADNIIIDFKRGSWPGLILRTKGLSSPEHWGTWSQSDMVLFEFAAPLPREFEVRLAASAFGPNVDGEFVASVGSYSSKFRLSSNIEERIINLKNPEGSNVLRIKIPNAISPKSLGLSGDDRNLGIGFVQMRVVNLHK